MKRLLFTLFSLAFLLATVASADDYTIPDCRLGIAPVNVGRDTHPNTEQYFDAPVGAEVRMEFRKPGDNKLSYVVCRFNALTPSWAIGPGIAWDVESGNNYTSNGNWVIPYRLPASKQGLQGEKGNKGDKGDTPIITDEALNRAARAVVGRNLPPQIGWRRIMPNVCEGSRTRATTCGVVAFLAAACGAGAGPCGGDNTTSTVVTLPPTP